MLGTGRFPPGSRVSTLELSKELGISRTPVREALSQLASQGIVKEMPGYGVYVQIPARQEIEELYGMREVLEAYATAQAGRLITDAELAQLEFCCQQWLALAKHIRGNPDHCLEGKLHERWMKIDEKFHTVLLGASRNQLLSKTVKDMRLLGRTLDVTRTAQQSLISLSTAAKTYRHHATLVRALRRRNVAAAEQWMKIQIRAARARRLEELDAFLTRTARPH